jgi:hypothetical protein
MEERASGTWQRLRSSEAFSFALTAAACAAIIVLRNPAAVFRAEFWAEDATEFFFGSISRGAGSLVTPVWGFHCFFARVVAYAATYFPVLWAPYLYAVACLLVNAGVTSYFVRDGFSWIIPSRPFRIAACAVFAIGPGTSEVFLNLCNLQSVLTIFTLLLLIEQPFRIGNFKAAALLVLLFSSVLNILWIPLVALLWHRTRDRRYGLLLLCFLPVLLINGIGTHESSGEANLRNYGLAWKIPKILVENCFLRLCFMPILGDSLTVSLMRQAWMFWLASLVVIASLGYLLLSGRLVNRTLWGVLGIAGVCAIGSFGAIAVSRSYAVGQIVRESGLTQWGHRYSYLPGMPTLLLWSAAIFAHVNRRPRDLTAFAAALAAGLLIWNNLAEWNTGYSRATQDLHWPKAAAALQDILDQREKGSLREPVLIEDIRWVHPAGWQPAHGGLRLLIKPRGS